MQGSGPGAFRSELRATLLAAIAIVTTVAASCDASFRFDDHDAAAVDATANTAWTGIETCGSSCSLSCAGPRTCIGDCAGACTAVCPPGSDCTLITGRGSTVTCESSRCNINIMDQSVLHCQGSATCDLVCPRDCTLDCGPSARCTVKCHSDPSPRVVTGMVICTDM